MADDTFSQSGATPEFRGEKRELADIYAISDRMSVFEGWVARYKIRSAGRLVHAARGVLEELAGLDRAFAERDEARRQRMLAAQRLKRVNKHIRLEEIADEEALDEAELNREKQVARRAKERREMQQGGASEEESPGRATIRDLEEKRKAERELRAWLAQVRLEEIRIAGGEEKLSPEQLKSLEDLEMHVGEAIGNLWMGQ